MKLEAVTVCSGYDDFLAETILWNRRAFDHWVIVTSPDDEATRRLCEFHHVHCVISDRLKPNDGEFRKGAGINDGLAALAGDGWIAHVDADMVLPPQTRSVLDAIRLDPGMVYGIDRMTVVGWKAWARIRRHPDLIHEASVYVHLPRPVSTRFIWPDGDGYVPIGFFQLWNPGVSGVRHYPEQHTNAGRGDMLFAANWPRERRASIPELAAYHLESEKPAAQGVNWNGRVTQRFEARGPLAQWRRHRRRRHRHHHPYWPAGH